MQPAGFRDRSVLLLNFKFLFKFVTQLFFQIPSAEVPGRSTDFKETVAKLFLVFLPSRRRGSLFRGWDLY